MNFIKIIISISDIIYNTTCNRYRELGRTNSETLHSIIFCEKSFAKYCIFKEASITQTKNPYTWQLVVSLIDCTYYYLAHFQHTKRPSSNLHIRLLICFKLQLAFYKRTVFHEKFHVIEWPASFPIKSLCYHWF